MEDEQLRELRKKARKCKLIGYSHMCKEELVAFISCSKVAREYDRKKREQKKLPPKTSKWVIYTKNGCGYCKQAKNTLKKHKYNFTEIEVTESNKSSIYRKIDSKTGSYRYFPVIFLNGKFLGGNTELQALFSK